MKTIYFLLVLSIALSSCRDTYDLPLKDPKKSFLVIEANLNPGPGVTTVGLTKTSGLDTRNTIAMVNNAQVIVEGRDNSSYSVPAAGAGRYQANLNLTIGNEYRLRVRTSDGKEYLSDYVKAKKAPSIDSINWEKENGDVRIYVNTHDPSRNSRYYRWEFEETWEIRSAFFSYFIYEKSTNTVRDRIFPQEDVSVCWKHFNSSSILLSNSTRLQDDIIYRQPLTLIADGDERLGVRYSILVKQYVLDKEAYNFFELMKRNTEEIGSIFSAQPSEVRGNIACVNDPGEYVLGYVTSSTVEQSRIFIQTPWTFRMTCEEKIIPDNPDSLRYYFGGGSMIPYLSNFPPPVYLASYAECVDCTVRGGSKVRPSFW